MWGPRTLNADDDDDDERFDTSCPETPQEHSYFILDEPYINYCNIVWAGPQPTKLLDKILKNLGDSWSQKILAKELFIYN